MFRGSVPADMRSLVHETARVWGVDEVWVGCSGNFTIERTLSGLVPSLHSNDVQLYSSAIGWWAAGEDVPITVRPESRDALGWLDPYLAEDRDSRLACVLLGSRFLGSVGKEDNPYHARVLQATVDQWEGMHAKTVEKIRASDLQVASFHALDVNEWMERVVPEDAAVMMFPPFFANDYETQFKALDTHLDWPEPEYPPLDEAGKDRLVELITGRDRWLIGLHVRRDHLEPFLRGMVQTTNRGVPIYVYASDAPQRVVRPAQATEPVFAPRLTLDGVLGDRIGLAPLSGGQFATLRSQYMNHNISPGSPLLACAVVVDGIVVGAFAFGSPTAGHQPGQAYLLSDFPVAPTGYKRLAQLIVRAATSREARLLFQRATSMRCTTILTTAFTNRPVSMKYRAVFGSPLKREPATDGIHEWMLNYGGPMGEQTLQEHFEAWKAKHG